MQKIGMVVAMDKEILPMLSALGKCNSQENIGNYNVKTFVLKDKEIYLVKSGIGEIFASGATQLLITKYNVEIIINFGVCGTLTDKLDISDIAIVKGVVHYDFDLSPIDPVEVGQYPNMGVVIETDKGVREEVKKLSPNIREVICASADKFVADENIKKNLNLKYNAEVCEMECAGILLTSINNGVPCLIIKAVSDGKGGAKEFELMCERASHSYIDLIVKLIDIL